MTHRFTGAGLVIVVVAMGCSQDEHNSGASDASEDGTDMDAGQQPASDASEDGTGMDAGDASTRHSFAYSLSNVVVSGGGCVFAQDVDGPVEGRIDLERTHDGYRGVVSPAWVVPHAVSVEEHDAALVLSGRVLGAEVTVSPGDKFSDYWQELRLERAEDGTLSGVLTASGYRNCISGGDAETGATITGKGVLGPDSRSPEMNPPYAGEFTPPWVSVHVSLSEPVALDSWVASSTFETLATSELPAGTVDVFWDLSEWQQESVWNGVQGGILRLPAWSQVNGRDVRLSFGTLVDPSGNQGEGRTLAISIVDVGEALVAHDFEQGMHLAASGSCPLGKHERTVTHTACASRERFDLRS